MNFGKPGTLISLRIYLGLAYAFFKLWKSKSIYAWSIGFFIATISIVSNLVFPVGTFMNERFIFIPSIAFSLVSAWVFDHSMDGIQKNLVLKWGSVALIILISGSLYFQNLHPHSCMERCTQPQWDMPPWFHQTAPGAIALWPLLCTNWAGIPRMSRRKGKYSKRLSFMLTDHSLYIRNT